MKKYLMTGIAALALGGIITSCSHDMDQYKGGTASCYSNMGLRLSNCCWDKRWNTC